MSGQDMKLSHKINFEAWSRTLIGFIRHKGLEQELKDWSGGWPCPIGSDGRLYDAGALMADGGDTRMTAAEEVLAYLLVEIVGVPDDVAYSPERAQLIIETRLKQSAKAEGRS